jgi:hypothetical protein
MGFALFALSVAQAQMLYLMLVLIVGIANTKMAMFELE